MRQHVTPEQLAELTPEQQEKLREWWRPEDGDWFADYEKDECVVLKDEVVSWHCPDNNCLPLLSIGQCIELLGIDKVFRICQGSILAATYDGRELIDALWDIVKIHLSKNRP